MFAPYRTLFATPGALAFTLAGLLARLGGSMSGVATIVLVADRRGSYALAGAVSAAGVISAAVLMPVTGRLIDRHGQARVAVPATLLSAVPLVGLLLCARYGAPAWALIACSAAGSTVPNLGGMARARWAHLHPDDEEARHRASALEQALDELCYLTGPVLAMLLCTGAFPEAGRLVGGVACALGVVLFAAQRSTEPPAAPPAARPTGKRGALSSAGLRVLAPAFLATGVVFGSLEVATIAYADSLGRKPLAGLLLALVAAGSCGSGLALGLRRPRRPPAARLLTGMAAMAGLMLLPLATGLGGCGLGVLAVALLAAGSGTAPTMVSGMTLLQGLVPEHRLNEAMAVVVSAILTGISAGSALGGAVAQHFTPGTGFLVPAGAALLALLIATAGFDRLNHRPALA